MVAVWLCEIKRKQWFGLGLAILSVNCGQDMRTGVLIPDPICTGKQTDQWVDLPFHFTRKLGKARFQTFECKAWKKL